MARKPGNTPQLDVEAIGRIIAHRKPQGKFCIIGIRGYYLDSMGVEDENDRKIYDDAILIVDKIDLPPAAFHVFRFNANVDPGAYRRGIANLKSGNWRYRRHKHKGQYWALGQAAPVTVERDGMGDDTGLFGINIHKGGFGSVSSLGCQTIYPTQWEAFISKVEGLMLKHHMDEVTYVLLDEKDRRKYIEGIE